MEIKFLSWSRLCWNWSNLQKVPTTCLGNGRNPNVVQFAEAKVPTLSNLEEMLGLKPEQYLITNPVGLWVCCILVQVFIYLDAMYKELSTYGLDVEGSTSTLTNIVIESDRQAITILEAFADSSVGLSQIQQMAKSYTIWIA